MRGTVKSSIHGAQNEVAQIFHSRKKLCKKILGQTFGSKLQRNRFYEDPQLPPVTKISVGSHL